MRTALIERPGPKPTLGAGHHQQQHCPGRQWRYSVSAPVTCMRASQVTARSTPHRRPTVVTPLARQPCRNTTANTTSGVSIGSSSICSNSQGAFPSCNTPLRRGITASSCIGSNGRGIRGGFSGMGVEQSLHQRSASGSGSGRSGSGGLVAHYQPDEAHGAAATAVHDAAPAVSFADCIMFQAFGWRSCERGGWYKVVQSKVPDLKAAGITHVWLPPPSQSVSAQGYMPGQLYNLNSKYGNKDDLVALNKSIREAGMVPVADIVINHRCADEQVDGVWNKFRDDVDHKGRRLDWGAWAITSNDPAFKGTGNPDTGEDYGPAPDLDHANPQLRDALKDWLRWLHEDIGFDGWRLDFVKGYGARFVPEYIEASLPPGSVNVGEYWADLRWNGSDLEYNQNESRQRLVDWIKGAKESSAAFDFTTKGILQEVIKKCRYHCLRDQQGKAPGLLGWWPARTVTFVDNHDTGSSQQHWPFPAEHVAQGYAYIITHPGIPCIFWEHFFDWGDNLRKIIVQLIDIRKRNNIKADSKLEILCAESDMYVARIGGRLVIKMGPRFDMGKYHPKPVDGWSKAVNGKDYAIWERKEVPKPV